MGDWFVRPLGDTGPWQFANVGAGPRQEAEPDPGVDATLVYIQAGRYVCRRCKSPLVPCDVCGGPAVCGDVWCQSCQPDG